MKSVLLIGSNGYIGSYLVDRLSSEDSIRALTCDESSSPDNLADYRCNSDQLPREVVQEVDSVVFFGGCSSVASAVNDPARAIDKNLLELLNLARMMGPHQQLIYASSASVYSSPQSTEDGQSPTPMSNEESPLRRPQNAYDATKQAFDLIAAYLPVKTLGLRLGTLSGMSRKLRPELVFNSMTIAALTKGRVNLQNSKASRAILFLEDLYEVLLKLIEDPSLTEDVRVLNVASVSTTFGELANRIASHLNASVDVLPDSQTYSFAMDTSLMNRARPASARALEQQIDKFSAEYGATQG
jgi:UDP-glucose 4-epimerase